MMKLKSVRYVKLKIYNIFACGWRVKFKPKKTAIAKSKQVMNTALKKKYSKRQKLSVRRGNNMEGQKLQSNLLYIPSTIKIGRK